MDAPLDLDSDRRGLAGATARRDGAAVVALLSGRDPGLLLQHAGTGLLVALTQQAEGATGLVAGLVAALTERDWCGDDELAGHLSAAAGGPPTGRVLVPADLDMVADLLEGDLAYGFGGHLDRTTGEAWPEAAFEDGAADEDLDLDDDQRWLRVPNLGSRDGWRDMHAFATGMVTEPDLTERLLDAIEGRGAFSRFRRVMDGHPGQLPSWHAFRDERRAGRARDWLAGTGYDASPP
ncbi:MAG TPA: UPF0158 family protein, partial [Candidatus Lustribacter sp.]|nr:UPF0158 family protein [Candidatus Lustribacter sp.]